MSAFLGYPTASILGQLMIGMINGSFYALMSLGLAVIFGMLHVINFAHGALYMLGAFLAWWAMTSLGLGYWSAIIFVPVSVALIGLLVERTLLRRVYRLDPLYGLLLTFGIALLLEGSFLWRFGTAGQPYPIPNALRGSADLGFMILPIYRGWVIVVSLVLCLATWLLIERTKMGAYLRAATENPSLVQSFGVNVPLLMSLTYAVGAGLAAFAGVMAAPIYQVSPLMGQNMLIVTFAIVVIGGMGSILGSIVTGYALGLVEGIMRLVYPEGSQTVVFVAMTMVLILRPSGLFGRT